MAVSQLRTDRGTTLSARHRDCCSRQAGIRSHLDVLVDLRDHLDRVEVLDRVLTEKVELNLEVGHALHMLHPEVTATHRVSLFLRVLFATSTEREFVDKVQRRRTLSVQHNLRRPTIGCQHV